MLASLSPWRRGQRSEKQSGRKACRRKRCLASLYLKAKPSFFGNYQWPWVDPTGATKVHTLPAESQA